MKFDFTLTVPDEDMKALLQTDLMDTKKRQEILAKVIYSLNIDYKEDTVTPASQTAEEAKANHEAYAKQKDYIRELRSSIITGFQPDYYQAIEQPALPYYIRDLICKLLAPLDLDKPYKDSETLIEDCFYNSFTDGTLTFSIKESERLLSSYLSEFIDYLKENPEINLRQVYGAEQIWLICCYDWARMLLADLPAFDENLTSKTYQDMLNELLNLPDSILDDFEFNY